jgi:peptidoglycan/xylan/chitin deacetylase (PgdA/CDA1 family)
MKLILALAILFCCFGAVADQPARPPQYVIMAFDGSYSLSMWQETLDYSKTIPLKFTYFISGPYFLLEKNKLLYTEPTKGPGKSAIGWGGSVKANIQKRVDFVNLAYDEGHEIGSHANGHFDGSTWTLPQWSGELAQFFNLIFNVFTINQIPSDAKPFHFDRSEIIGFRAPLLGRNASMYQTLSDEHFAYDTSQSAAMNYWPQLKNNIWNFPLADLRIAGTGKRTLSMDYNFYFTQSKGLSDPANYATYKSEMLATYLNYFKGNYYGNRAPINIGHHFSKWNGGAYWDALKEFSTEVCTLPEVRCVTYKEYLGFINAVDPVTLAAFRKGDFPKLEPADIPPKLRDTPPAVPVDLFLAKAFKNVIRVRTEDPEQVLEKSNTFYAWSVNQKEVLRSATESLALAQLTPHLSPQDILSVALWSGDKEIQKTSHRVSTVTRHHLVVEDEDLELESLKGDLPAAHIGEPL